MSDCFHTMHGSEPTSAARFLRQEETLLSALFFSSKNLDVLQNRLRYRVYRESGGLIKIGRQPDTAMLSIMRDLYESSDRFAPESRVIQEIERLNEAVMAIAVPETLSAAEFHQYYLRDTALPNPIPQDRPALASRSGTKVLELRPGF